MTLTQYGCQVAIAVYQAIHQRLLQSGTGLMYPDELAAIVASVTKRIEVHNPGTLTVATQQSAAPIGPQQQGVPSSTTRAPSASSTATSVAQPFAAGKLKLA